LAARAHRDALNAPRPVDTSFRTCWDDMECILDVVLAKFETRFLHSLSLLDTLLSIPSPRLHDAEKLRNQVPNNLVTLGYFFDKLTHAAWLQPLRADVGTHFLK